MTGMELMGRRSSHPDLSLLLNPSSFPSTEFPPNQAPAGTLGVRTVVSPGEDNPTPGEDRGLWPSPQGEVTIRDGPEGISPLPGDVHVGMADRNGQLEVDVIQARGLIPKLGSKCIPGRWLWREGSGTEGRGCRAGIIPGSSRDPAPRPRFSRFPTAATYVKVYLLENGVCLAKKKTKVVKKTCDPSYQQPLLFEESPQGKVLQVGRVTFPYPRWLHPRPAFPWTLPGVGRPQIPWAGMPSLELGCPL